MEIPTINYHLKEIYASGELTAESTIRKFLIVQREGKRDVAREIDFYNLDATISVGYRVNSAQATQFRIWANKAIQGLAATYTYRNASSKQRCPK